MRGWNPLRNPFPCRTDSFPMVHAVEFHDKKPALLVIDVQNKFTEITDGLKRSMLGKMETVNGAIDLFRERNRPVVYMLFDGMGHLDREIEEPDSLIPEIRKPLDGENQVHKTVMNSFHNTDLESVLKNMDCDSIVIVGLVAHLCVAATYYSAYDHDISPFILKGGIAATDEPNVEHVEAILNHVTMDDLLREL